TNMPQQCREQVARLGIKEFKDSKELLDKIRSLKADKLDVNSIRRKEIDYKEVLPHIHDGDFFPAPLEELRKKAIAKPLMTGVTKEEGLVFRGDFIHIYL
ncbi:hypothetical protein PMAYCL1PPCAC_22942, partial [Pristionchus mayeri]